MPPTTQPAFHFDHVLGTSLDLWLTAPDSDRVADAVLAGVGRVGRVFSLRDPDSELARLNNGPVPGSADLRTVLAAYDRVAPVTGGALNPLVGALARVWADAERTGREPDADVLARLATAIDRRGWELTADAVTRATPHPLDLNAGAKGFALDRARAAARAAGAAAGLVNLGGDMIGWGDAAHVVGVQNPFAPAENARPLGALRLRNAAVATSGGYQRGYDVGGERRSHLIDPRTGRPADRVASATVVAADSLTANLLATALAVLDPAAGLRLVADLPGVEALVIDADGRQSRSPGFALESVVPARPRYRKAVAAGALTAALFVVAGAPDAPLGPSVAVAQDAPAKGEPWPAGFQVSVALELPKIDGARKYRRPYVAVYVEDGGGKAVKTIGVWGNEGRWLKDLSDWWKIGKTDGELVKAVTRATRGPGKYELTWDGKDEKGAPVPRGEYTVRVEVHREHGKHVRQSGKIALKGEPATLKLAANDETGETVVTFGPGKK
jgi:thiamine biosynthesis lipoprotein